MNLNNKGFTIIELMSAFAIMMVLAGVALGAYNDIVGSSYAKTYTIFEKNLLGAAKNYIMDHQGEDVSNFTKTAKELIDEGYLERLVDPASGTDCDYNKSYVKLVGNYSQYNLVYDKSKTKVCLCCNSYSTDGCSC